MYISVILCDVVLMKCSSDPSGKRGVSSQVERMASQVSSWLDSRSLTKEQMREMWACFSAAGTAPGSQRNTFWTSVWCRRMRRSKAPFFTSLLKSLCQKIAKGLSPSEAEKPPTLRSARILSSVTSFLSRSLATQISVPPKRFLWSFLFLATRFQALLGGGGLGFL